MTECRDHKSNASRRLAWRRRRDDVKVHATGGMTRLRGLVPLLAVLVVSVLVAGCGGNDDSSSDTGSSTGAASRAVSGIVAEAQKMVAQAN
jgi:hypothetical protein